MKAIPVLAVAAFAALASQVDAAEPTTLRFAMTAPAHGWSWQHWFSKWIPKVESESGDAVKIQTYPGSTLANMVNAYDRVTSGVADLAYSVTGTMRGKFTGTNVITLPSDANGKEGSGGMWKLVETGLTADEFADTVPLFLYVYPQTVLHLQKPVTRLDDIKGLKIGAASKVSADVIQAFGAAPVTTNPGEMYEILQRRVVTGMAMGWNGVLTFKLQEVTNYHLNVEIGSGGGFMVVNKDTWAKLPERAQEAFKSNSGYAASKAFGVVIDGVAAEQYATVSKMPGHTQARLEPAERRRWQALIDGVTDAWIKETPNGAAILAGYRKAVADIRAGM